MRPVQYFSDDYLENCRKLSPDQVLRFLDEFAQLHGPALLAEREREIQRLTEVLAHPWDQDSSRDGLDAC